MAALVASELRREGMWMEGVARVSGDGEGDTLKNH